MILPMLRSRAIVSSSGPDTCAASHRASSRGFPWGYLVYRNIEGIVRAEMDAAGFQEVHFPALLPREPYERTNRWEEYGDNLFRLQDRKGGDYLLGPTHEDMFTLMVKG